MQSSKQQIKSFEKSKGDYYRRNKQNVYLTLILRQRLSTALRFGCSVIKLQTIK